MIAKAKAIALVALALFYCAPSPVDKVDLSKARSSLSLVSGAAISSPNSDDYNPHMVHKEDGTLILLFGSNRPCTPCTAGNYHIFIASSVTPYYPNPVSVGVIPPFNTPVQINNVGAEITLGASRANFNAVWTQGGVFVLLEHAGQIKSVNIAAFNLAAGDAAGAPLALANSSRINDKLLSGNFKDFTMLTVSGGTVRKSAMNSVDAGAVQANAKLPSAGSAAIAHYAYSGYTDALFYQDSGGLSSGRYGIHGDAHFFFNYALTRYGLTLSYVSVFSAPLSIKGAYWKSNDLILFSAGSSPGSHDLYLANSHTAEDLTYLDSAPSPYAPVNIPFLPATNFPPFRVFATSMPVPGGFGGVPAADGLCNSDFAAMPDLSVHYKALIADGAMRSPPASLRLDWVLQPLAKYIRGDTGATIQTTDATGVFPFPIAAITGAPANVWTGLTSTWLDGANTCNAGMGSWSDVLGVMNGDVGTATATTNAAINNATPIACNMPAILYCVEQPFNY